MPAGFRKVYQYELNGDFVKEYENISAASFAMNEEKQSLYFCLKGKYNHSRGYFWSFDYYMKLPNHIINKIKNSKNYKLEQYKKSKVYQYDLEGNFLKEYSCLNEISNDKNYNLNILRVLDGSYKISHNSIWKNEYYKKLPNNILKQHTHVAKKNVYEYDLEGNFIKKYPTVLSVSKYLKCEAGSVTNALNGQRCKVFKNCIFRTEYYEKLPIDILNYHLKIKKPPILQYDLNGKFIKEWNLSDLKEKFRIGNIYSVLNGSRDNASGYFWKYKK